MRIFSNKVLLDPILAGLAGASVLLCALFWYGQTAVLGGGAALLVLAAICLFGFSLQALLSLGRRMWFRNAFASHPNPSFLTSLSGAIIVRNQAADFAWEISDEQKEIQFALNDLYENGASQANRLIGLAERQGHAADMWSINGKPYRINVTRSGFLNRCYLWLFTAMPEHTKNDYPDVSIPVAQLAPNGDILEANAAFDQRFGSRSHSMEILTDGDSLQVNTYQTLRTKNGKQEFLIIQNGSLELGAELFFFETIGSDLRAGFDVDIFYNLPVAMLKLRTDGTIQSCNRAASLLLGPRLSGMASFDTVFDAGERSAKAWLSEALDRPPLTRWDFLKLRTTEREVILQVALMQAETGTGEGLIFAALTDVTELKSLEAQFVQSQKMQAIGQLAGGVAHDFNNLLTAISGHCDLLLLKHESNDPDYSDLMQIHLNTNRAASLVGQLLAFSRKQTLSLEALDLRDSLSELAHLLNRLVGEKVELELRHHPNLRKVRADRRQLEQVVMNLVVNARDAMPEGGKVCVETDHADFERAIERDAAIIPPGRYVLIRVIDQGVGIRPDEISRIFDPFWTTKKTGDGTGLGLSTAYGIVKQSGGFLFVESELGQGSSFEVLLPESTAKNVPDAIEPTVKNTPVVQNQGEGVILLVEDEAPVRAFASRALQLKGYTVIEAESGEAALETLDQCEAEVDLFVTDMIMPGMDGPTWVELAKERKATAKVLFMSGYAAESLKDKQKKFPDAAFLPKPFSLHSLTDIVGKILA